MAEIIVPIEKTAKKAGKTTVSGGGGVVVKDSTSKTDKEVVGARDYVSSKGYSGIVDWDGENVLVGGQAIRPETVKNGTAYVKKTELDSAISDFEDSNGIIGNRGVLEKYEKKYGDTVNKALKELTDRDEFSYEPDDDPAYLAYKDEYEQLAEEAFRRVLNYNNTSVTGASGAVLSEALASRNEYLDELAKLIPELQDNAYDRYIGETQRLVGNLEAVWDVSDSYYDMLYQSNRDAIDDATEAGEAEREEKQRWVDNTLAEDENKRQAALDEYELELLASEVMYYPAVTESKLEETRLGNEETALSNALARGFFIKADEAALPWLAEFRSGRGYSIEPETAVAALEYSKSYSRQRGTINAKLGL